VSSTHLGPTTNFFFLLEIFFRQLQVCYIVVPSLTRGRLCNLLLLLVLANTVPLGSESRWTQDHILFSQFLRLPQLGRPGPHIYIPQLKLKLKLIYNQQSVGQSVLVSGTHLGPRDQFFFLLEIVLRQLRLCYFIAPSLTREWVCNLIYNCFWPLPEQSLLGQSPSELTAIFYCLI
jgi:hypothetical protein